MKICIATNAGPRVPEGDLHCQCILSIFPASVHQFYANLLVFVNINPFLYINDQFALIFITPLEWVTLVYQIDLYAGLLIWG